MEGLALDYELAYDALSDDEYSVPLLAKLHLPTRLGLHKQEDLDSEDKRLEFVPSFA